MKASAVARQDDVVEHQRPAAQQPEIIACVLRDRQEESAGAADPAEMTESDAREFGKGDGQDREIDT